jgi:hypothetical protein
MKTSDGKNEFDRLKAELRRLKRTGAPWYFDSVLHQRLHGGRRRHMRHAPFRIGPLITISVATLAAIALAVYVLLLNSTLFSPSGGPHPGSALGVQDTISHSQLSTKPEATSAAPEETTSHGASEHRKNLPQQVVTSDTVTQSPVSDTQRSREKPVKVDQETAGRDSLVLSGGDEGSQSVGKHTLRARRDSAALKKNEKQGVRDSSNEGSHAP